ncbi:MltA domain-containing protein [soil metagenome]
MRICCTLLAPLVVCLLLAGCHHEAEIAPPTMNYNAELPPGTLALRKISPAEYPDFSDAFLRPNLPDVIAAINHSLNYLQAPSSQHYYPYADISHDRAVATLETLRSLLLDRSFRSREQWNAVIADKFEVYKSVGAPNADGPGYSGKVLFTGYFTPIYPASATKTAEFQWPLYKRPEGMVSDDEGKKAFIKSANGQMVPYPYSRQQLEQQHLLDGTEMVWLNNRWDAYVISVQGSARLKLLDGRTLEVGYAGNNGMDYVSPGKQLVADNLIPKDQLSLKGLRQYFQQHPDAMDKYLWLNPRFVFFTERPGGPFGSLNQPVTTFATIATDKDIYPRAMAAFVSTTIPSSLAGGTTPYKAWMLDQDAGGAICAADCCDLYMGIGPAAEGVAGQQMYPGELYYLAVKPDGMK